jgi:pseudaminic acid biosynthesis-associated methylase
MSEELWRGEFGDSYTRRNALTDLRFRTEMWRILLPNNCTSILEVGANVGSNLEAISEFSNIELYACEPNELAREQLQEIVSPTHVTADWADKLSFPSGVADLVFTCGVLIHVPPDKLLKSLQEIHRCAKHWIICGEYFAPSEEMVPYRGHNDQLWRRDYGSLYLDNFSDLHCQSTTFAWDRMTGLDNLTFWVFQKGPRWN